jgi:hypothetical protein
MVVFHFVNQAGGTFVSNSIIQSIIPSITIKSVDSTGVEMNL